MAAGGGGADEGFGVEGEGLHSGFIAEDAAAAGGRGRVDGKDGDGAFDVGGEGLDEGALPCPGDAGDPEAKAAAGMGKNGLEKLLGEGLVGGEFAFYEGDGAGENNTVGGENAVAIGGQR